MHIEIKYVFKEKKKEEKKKREKKLTRFFRVIEIRRDVCLSKRNGMETAILVPLFLLMNLYIFIHLNKLFHIPYKRERTHKQHNTCALRYTL